MRLYWHSCTHFCYLTLFTFGLPCSRCGEFEVNFDNLVGCEYLSRFYHPPLSGMLLLICFCHSLDTCSQSKLCVECHYINDKEIVFFSQLYIADGVDLGTFILLYKAIKDIIMLIYALLSVKVRCNLLCAA